MFRKSFQKGFLTVLFAGGSTPLKIWDRVVVNGHIKRVTDEDVRVLVLEMRGTNVATCYIYTPMCPKQVLGIRLPFLVMIVKNLKKYFSFEIMILDDRHMRRRFRVSNYQTTTKVRPFGTTMPIGLNPGWNQIQFNLADFTKRAYGSSYVETQRIQIHANCRIRRIYFCDKLYSEDEIPNDYRLFYPCAEEKVKKEKECQEAEVPPPSVAGDDRSVASVDEDIIIKSEESQAEEELLGEEVMKSDVEQEEVVLEPEAFFEPEDEEPPPPPPPPPQAEIVEEKQEEEEETAPAPMPDEPVPAEPDQPPPADEPPAD